jgi:hypothetical protein
MNWHEMEDNRVITLMGMRRLLQIEFYFCSIRSVGLSRACSSSFINDSPQKIFAAPKECQKQFAYLLVFLLESIFHFIKILKLKNSLASFVVAGQWVEKINMNIHWGLLGL